MQLGENALFAKEEWEDFLSKKEAFAFRKSQLYR